MRHALALVLVLVGSGCGKPNPIAPQSFTPDAVRKACAMELSCLSPAPITSGSDCVAQFEEGMLSGYGIIFGPSAADLARYVNCSSSAGDCTSALKCASRNHGLDWCAAHPNASCDGDTLVGCLGGWGLELTDCGSFGLRCVTANGVSLCSDGKSCNPTAPARCDGNTYVSCDTTAKLGQSIDCGAYGRVCRQIMSGSSTETGCFGMGSATCPANTSEMDSCDGKTVVACTYGTQLRLDCTQIQAHCEVGAPNKTSCVFDASDCSAGSPDSCVGNGIQICVNGKWTTTACSSFGLSSCETTGMGVKCR
jgi:hypothetical protein